MSSDLKELADELKGFLDRSCINDGAEKFLREVESALRTLASREKKPFGWLGNDGKFSLPFDVTREQFLSHFAGHDLPTGTPVIPLYTAPQKPQPAPGWDEAIEAAAKHIEMRAGSVPDRQEIAAEIRALRREAPAPEGVVSVELLNIERATGDRLRSENDKLRATIASLSPSTSRPDAGGGVRVKEENNP